VAEIERLGFTWREDPQYPLANLSPERRIQVRDDKNYAPKEGVARYAEQMGHSVFPPIIVTEDGWIDDGNTRVGGALVRGQNFYPALVLGVEWEGPTTTEAQRQNLYLLAATLNSQNGNPLTESEKRRACAEALRAGWKAEQIGRAVGVHASGVTQIRKEIDAEIKLHKVGMDSNGSLKGASLRALGTKEALGLNDEPFKALAVLAGDAGLNAGEINTAAKEAKATGSDTAAIAYLDTQRTEMADRIRNRQLTGVGSPPVSRQLRQHLGFITKFAGREAELIEGNPNVFGTHVEALKSAIAVLTEVLKRQNPDTSAAA
jgi:hypothetical protein